jgi:hypothetical protein
LIAPSGANVLTYLDWKNMFSFQYRAKRELKQERISFNLALILVFAVILGSIHHHHDLEDHPDCSICMAAHCAPAIKTVPLLPAIRRPALPELIVQPVANVPVSRPIPTFSGRAPPTSSRSI